MIRVNRRWCNDPSAAASDGSINITNKFNNLAKGMDPVYVNTVCFPLIQLGKYVCIDVFFSKYVSNEPQMTQQTALCVIKWNDTMKTN